MTYVILIAMLTMPTLLGLCALRQAVEVQPVPARIPLASCAARRK